MTRDENNRGRIAPRSAAQLPAVEASERLLSRLTGFTPSTQLPMPSQPAPRYRARCSLCKDVGRVKPRGTIGVVEPCPACDAGFVPDPKRAEGIIDSVIIRPRKQR